MELLAYDIFDNKTRNVFRNFLKSIGFVEVQKSLYFSIQESISQQNIKELISIIKDNKHNRFIIVPCNRDNIWKYEGQENIMNKKGAIIF